MGYSLGIDLGATTCVVALRRGASVEVCRIGEDGAAMPAVALPRARRHAARRRAGRSSQRVRARARRPLRRVPARRRPADRHRRPPPGPADADPGRPPRGHRPCRAAAGRRPRPRRGHVPVAARRRPRGADRGRGRRGVRALRHPRAGARGRGGAPRGRAGPRRRRRAGCRRRRRLERRRHARAPHADRVRPGRRPRRRCPTSAGSTSTAPSCRSSRAPSATCRRWWRPATAPGCSLSAGCGPRAAPPRSGCRSTTPRSSRWRCPTRRGRVEITRDAFERTIEAALVEAVDLVLATIEDAGLIPADLRAVVVTGGSARIPRVTELLDSAPACRSWARTGPRPRWRSAPRCSPTSPTISPGPPAVRPDP